MKRGSRFLIGFAAAVLTFGSLMAALGPQRFGKHCYGSWRGHHCYYDQHGTCNDNLQNNCTGNDTIH